MSEEIIKKIISNQNKLRKKQVEENKDFLKDKLFLEFGVFMGHSIIDYYNIYLENDIKPNFFGFDAFEGLPEERIDTHSPWNTGDFNLNGNINPELLNKDGMQIIKGWFSDTFNDDTIQKFTGKKAGLVHIDCDIYTSTLEVLEFLVKNNLLVDGTIIVYDDWGAWKQSGLQEKDEYNVAEGRAHKEICEKYNLKFERLYTTTIDPEYYYITTFKYKK